MNADYIENIIRNIEDQSYRCILIDGAWGIGKSYMVEKALEDLKGRTCFVSLFGMDNAQQIYHEILFQLFFQTPDGGKMVKWLRDATKFLGNFNGKATTAYRDLDEFQTFIRYPVASEIVKKVKEDGELTLDKVVSSRKPFGLATTAKPMKTGDITLRYNGGRGPYKSTEIRVGTEMIDQWKIIISRLTAEHAGQPAKDGKYRVLSTMELLKPGEICSETYLVAGAFDSKEEATNYMDYLKTQFVRFLILQIAMTQQLSKASFAFVPCQDFTRKWTDKQLFEKYDLSSEEVNYIQGMIKEMA